ncbi:MAG: terminase family protein [Rhizobiaceae bacterium]|nr:terminase family protein [Rhizobiaceae bacterium]
MTGPISEEDWIKVRQESIANLGHVIDSVGLPHVLLPYQAKTVELLDSTAVRVLFVEKSRRVGETWGIASYAVLRAGRAKQAKGMDVLYVSYKQEIAKEFIDVCGMWARAFAVAAAEADEYLFEDVDLADPGNTRKIQAYRIRFASGFQIIALSSAPRSLRGHQGDVIIDEAAFVDSLKELLKAALAMRMWGGKIVVCSTHNGAENEFNTHIQDIQAGRSKYRHLKVDFDQALLDGLYQRICLVTGEEWSPEAEAKWRQEIIDDYGELADEELFCIPTMGSGAWLTAPLIEARMKLTPEQAPILRISLPPDYLQREKVERAHLLAAHLDGLDDALKLLNPKWMHAFGYDPARRADPAVMTLLSIDSVLVRRTALTIELRNVPFAEQKAITRAIFQAAPRLVGAAIDATGMGMNLAEDLGREFGFYIPNDDPEKVVHGLVWQVSLGPVWYNDHMPPLKAAFEDAAILLTADAEHLVDLRLVKVIRGVPSIPPERVGEAGKKRHGDFAVALALAHAASRLQWHEYAYVSVPLPPNPYSEPPAERGYFETADQADRGVRLREGGLRRERRIF